MVLTKHHKTKFFIILLLIISPCKLQSDVIISVDNINESSKKISYTFVLTQKDFLYKDFLQFSIADPHITLSEWQTDSKPKQYYDPLFKNNKYIFTKTCTISIVATPTYQWPPSTYLYCTYYQKSEKQIKQIEYELLNNTIPIQQTDTNITNLPSYQHEKKQKNISFPPSSIEIYLKKLYQYTSLLLQYNDCIKIISYCFIIVIFLLCIIWPYFLSKKIYHRKQLLELLTITTITSVTILLGYVTYLLYNHIVTWHRVLIVLLYTFTFGIFYLKKGTQLTNASIRTFCTIVGVTFLATIIPLFFTMAHYW